MTTYEERKAKGLCVKCGKPARPGKVQCAECALKQRNARIAQKEERAKFGVCSVCGKRKRLEGMKTCEQCRDEAYKYNYVHMRKRYYDLKQKGLCVICAKNPADKGHTMCAECLEKKRQTMRQYVDRCKQA